MEFFIMPNIADGLFMIYVNWALDEILLVLADIVEAVGVRKLLNDKTVAINRKIIAINEYFLFSTKFSFGIVKIKNERIMYGGLIRLINRIEIKNIAKYLFSAFSLYILMK